MCRGVLPFTVRPPHPPPPVDPLSTLPLTLTDSCVIKITQLRQMACHIVPKQVENFNDPCVTEGIPRACIQAKYTNVTSIIIYYVRLFKINNNTVMQINNLRGHALS